MPALSFVANGTLPPYSSLLSCFDMHALVFVGAYVTFPVLLTPASAWEKASRFCFCFSRRLSYLYRCCCLCFGYRYLFTVAHRFNFIANNFIKNVLTFSPTAVAYRKAFIGSNAASAFLLVNSFVTRLLWFLFCSIWLEIAKGLYVAFFLLLL